MLTSRRSHFRWFQALAIGGALLPAVAQGQTPADFDSATYSVGNNPQGMAAADLDGDGVLDLAVAERFSSSVSVLLGLGDGSFGAKTSFSVGSQPLAVVAADLDGDGLMDLASANIGGGSVSLLIGDGAGSFAAAQHLSVGFQPQDLVAADFDGDGLVDLAIAHDSLSAPVTLLWNSASGFGAPEVVAIGFCAAAIRAGDLDGDGLVDLIVADCTQSMVRPFLSGGGSLNSMGAWPVAQDPRGLEVADLNGDGHLDVAVACVSSSVVSVVLGLGDGTFASSQEFGAGVMPQRVVSGDYNADGHADLVTTNFGSGDMSVLMGDGQGAFGAPATYSAGIFPAGLLSADTSGDGLADFVVANAFSNSLTVFTAIAPPAPPWTDLGGAVVGKASAITLIAEGLPIPGESVWLLVKAQKRKTPHAYLVIGFDDGSVLFKGGTLVPTVDMIMKIRTNRARQFVWPASAPVGSSLYFQAWLRPHAKHGGASGSNALRGITQP